MPAATIDALTFATASSAPFWIAGWIIVLALIIGLPIYLKRRRRDHRPPQCRPPSPHLIRAIQVGHVRRGRCRHHPSADPRRIARHCTPDPVIGGRASPAIARCRRYRA